MTKQGQRVEGGGRAIQAGRDIVVHAGMSPEQMTEIMVAMGRQLSLYQADALKIVEERLAAFQQETMKVFLQRGRANPEAFRDPDFQYLINDAQQAYVRSGDTVVRDTLIDIIARRSLETDRSRITVTLNDAATKAPLLTTNEFAELSLAYLVRHTRDPQVNGFQSFCAMIERRLIPFVRDISREMSSYWHLEAQCCATLEISTVELFSTWRAQYAGVLGRGFDRTQLESHLPDGKKNALDTLIIQCLHDTAKLQPNAMSRDLFRKRAGTSGLTEAEVDNVWNLFENTVPVAGDLIAMLEPHIAQVKALEKAWNDTPMCHLKLNSVGIAIGHANAVRAIGFAPDLGEWIK